MIEGCVDGLREAHEAASVNGIHAAAEAANAVCCVALAERSADQTVWQRPPVHDLLPHADHAGGDTTTTGDFAFLVFMVEHGLVNGDELLSTGQAAEVLGCSRQHVVDLCSSGQLPHVTVGTHRRVRRRDAEAFLWPALRRDEERSLWLHQVVAGRLATDTARVLATGHANMRRLRGVHPDGGAAWWLDRWDELLDAGVDAVFEALTSRARWAIELRQNSPFAGVLTTEERQAALSSFRTHWKTAHAA